MAIILFFNGIMILKDKLAYLNVYTLAKFFDRFIYNIYKKKAINHTLISTTL